MTIIILYEVTKPGHFWNIIDVNIIARYTECVLCTISLFLHGLNAFYRKKFVSRISHVFWCILLAWFVSKLYGSAGVTPETLPAFWWISSASWHFLLQKNWILGCYPVNFGKSFVHSGVFWKLALIVSEPYGFINWRCCSFKSNKNISMIDKLVC